MYIESIELEQIGEATGLTCEVLVRWTFGDDRVARVQIYRGPLGNAEPLRSEDIEAGKPTSTTVTVPSGHPQVEIFVCPRLVDDEGVPTDLMPDDHGEQRDWQAFAVARTIATRARQGTGEVHAEAKPAPTITGLTTIPAAVGLLPAVPGTSGTLVAKVPNRIRVHWIAGDDLDKYLVRWVSNDPRGRGNNPKGVDAEQDGKSGSFVLEGTIPGVEYSFNVKGAENTFLGNFPRYTDWSGSRSVVAQPNLTGLRAYLLHSGLDPRAGVRRYLAADGGRVRAFMQLG